MGSSGIGVAVGMGGVAVGLGGGEVGLGAGWDVGVRGIIAIVGIAVAAGLGVSVREAETIGVALATMAVGVISFPLARQPPKSNPRPTKPVIAIHIGRLTSHLPSLTLADTGYLLK